MHSRTIENLKATLKLSPYQREVLLGVLLGDGCLETQNGGRTYRLKIEQSLAHQDYVHHLYELFDGWALSPPRTRHVISSGHASENVAFSTLSHAAFRFYAHSFYEGCRKKVPAWIGHRLTPRVLSYWFMDDGSQKSSQSKGVFFNTQGFPRSQVELLIEVLQSNFDLQAKLRAQKDGWQIYVSGTSYERFASVVSPFIIPAMRHKLPPARNVRSKVARAR